MHTMLLLLYVSVHGAEINLPTLSSPCSLCLSLFLLKSLSFPLCIHHEIVKCLSLAAFLLRHLNYCSLLDNIHSFTVISCAFFLTLKVGFGKSWLLLFLLKALHKSGKIWKSVSCQLKNVVWNMERGVIFHKMLTLCRQHFECWNPWNSSEIAVVWSHTFFPPLYFRLAHVCPVWAECESRNSVKCLFIM